MNFHQKSASPTSLFLLFFFTVLVFATLSRIAFIALTPDTVLVMELFRGFLRSIYFDLAIASFLFVPVGVMALLFGHKWQAAWLQKSVFSYYFLVTLLLAFLAMAEFVFMEEFHSRFNFIAVDYLIYTNEVLKNIWQSYPVITILTPLVIAVFFLAKWSFKKTSFFLPSLKRHSSSCLFFLLLAAGFVLSPPEASVIGAAPANEAEIAKNGLHALFSAYRHNEIDFERFYASMNPEAAARLVHKSMARDYPNPKDLISAQNETHIVRNILRPGPEKKLNVVIVLMESMSARFMQSYGAEKRITPNLDAMAKEGLFFDHLYSTGTRTVRGIEAVVLSVPPTPGQSIVRRPDGTKLFNIGSVLRQRGYQTQFLYGGNSYFDNMGAFFENNGFEVKDKRSLNESQIRFANAWGVCDEDLFDMALREADRISSGPQAKPFLQFLLTTSNHRPYTYPENIPGLPKPAGRDEAVLYSDYSIGKFIESARAKPWFKDTIFLFVADHNASVAGGVKVLPADYRIPAIYFSPAHIKPQKNSMLGSQIDIAPTLFGLMNLSYQTKFFGHDLQTAKTERAFVGTYQRVGLWQNQKLVLLSPNREVEVNQIKEEQPLMLSKFRAQEGAPFSDPDVNDAVSYFETASSYFQNKLLKEERTFSTHENGRSY